MKFLNIFRDKSTNYKNVNRNSWSPNHIPIPSPIESPIEPQIEKQMENTETIHKIDKFYSDEFSDVSSVNLSGVFKLFKCKCNNSVEIDIKRTLESNLECNKCGREFNIGQKLLILTEFVEKINKEIKNNQCNIESITERIENINDDIKKTSKEITKNDIKKSFSKNVLNLIINKYCV